LIDEVGVEVADSIFREMEHYFPQRFKRSKICERLLANNFLGRKNGVGFYRYEAGQEKVNDELGSLLIASTAPAAQTSRRSTADGAEIADHLMRVMVDEAQRCLDEGVVGSADEVDLAFSKGAGFPASRGGLMQWARSAGLVK
jgi:3-hydroxyacyl-CoA dehydrogenase / enoyl-CoA hydratase / 3-hydroxybutyryl-CoA epimerase